MSIPLHPLSVIAAAVSVLMQPHTRCAPLARSRDSNPYCGQRIDVAAEGGSSNSRPLSKAVALYRMQEIFRESATRFNSR
jgi:hypothetical protein